MHESPLGRPAVMAVAALILFGALALAAEKIPLANSLGYDGLAYAEITRGFDRILNGTWRLDPLYYNRFLPSLLCRLTLLGLGLELTDKAIVGFYTWYNVLLAAAAAGLWAAAARCSGFSLRAGWFGFVALFCGHAMLKYNVYYASLTDVTAFTLGCLMLWAYLQRRDAVLALAALAGAATWPTLLPQGGLLLLFPRRPIASEPAPAKAWLLATAVTAVATWRFIQLGRSAADGAVAPWAGGIIVILYCLLALRYLADAKAFYSPRALLACTSPTRLLLALGCGLAATLVLLRVTGTSVRFFEQAEGYLLTSVSWGLRFPGEFIVSHTLYFGPWLLLLLLLFPRAAAFAREGGLGLTLVCAMTVAQSLTPLSRQLIAATPFLCWLCLQAMEKPPVLTPRAWTWLAVLCLFISKGWMRFSANPADPLGSFSFPWYVSSTGCWMPFPFYWTQGLLVFGLLLFFAWRLHAARRQAPVTTRL
ncbi:hypothetical protein [Solidesulfovibrio carbinolicus]|uniref:Glycosyltransferase RgtA/B/C/D-like domain-containing protein n=1 Tax=Solidesulfovibrio carbinolicus TaxID=296842 RepID=A0A4P6HTQ7_9BACT|nr:hypothetical protein [Solidesulfovibrio carbinolicus]QAZ69580.1 hypothetical protein C3Y92_20030 [Solidesulfovibrio carbinolicus]